MITGNERGDRQGGIPGSDAACERHDRYRAEYVPGVLPFLAEHDGEVLVGGFETEAAEGEPPNSTVVIRFPDVAAAWGFSTTRITSL